MLSCRLLGHRFRFTAEGRRMTWRCARGCGAGGAKTYPTARQARRYAEAFDREDRADLGLRAPLVAGLPLRLVRAWRRAAADRRAGRTSRPWPSSTGSDSARP